MEKFYWVARDSNGLLCAFNAKPTKYNGVFIRSHLSSSSKFIVIPSEYKSLFDYVTFENSPIIITISKKDSYVKEENKKILLGSEG